ncbi:MAG TPA: hypothetical protein VFJ14_14820 [Nocardioidaceae bacterium]|nr:hypothetical protein [Nocardioidaceae bacterium]
MTSTPLPTTALPTTKALRDLLLDLLGRDVEVAPTEPYAPEADERATSAVYVDDSMHTSAVMVADLPFSAYAGAAIGLVPVGGAKAAIEDRELAPTVRDNLYEVLNICASLLNGEGRPHVKLHTMYEPGAWPPADVSAYAKALGRRLDLTVDIAGYGSGRLSIVVVG